jgi:hypothetical protein
MIAAHPALKDGLAPLTGQRSDERNDPFGRLGLCLGVILVKLKQCLPVDVGESHAGCFSAQAFAQGHGRNIPETNQRFEQDPMVRSCPGITAQFSQPPAWNRSDPVRGQVAQDRPFSRDSLGERETLDLRLLSRSVSQGFQRTAGVKRGLGRLPRKMDGRNQSRRKTYAAWVATGRTKSMRSRVAATP